MARFSSPTHSFLGGEVSASSYNRADMPWQKHACKAIKNMIAKAEGGAITRPGTLYKENTTGNVAGRLIPFVVSQNTAYQLSLTGDSAIRSINVNSGAGSTVDDSGADIGSLWTVPQLVDVQVAQSASVQWLVHGSHRPHVLRNTGAGLFFLESFETSATGQLFGCDANTVAQGYHVPWRDVNVFSTATLAISTAAVGAGRTLTASLPLFDPLHVGAYFRITSGATTGVCIVTAYTNSTHVTATVLTAFADNTAHANWQESAWSNFRGWPKTVAIFKQALVYGGNASEPDTFWKSKTGAYGILSHTKLAQDATTPTAADPTKWNLASSEIDALAWMAPGRNMLVGTIGPEQVVESLSADAPSFYPESNNKSAQIQAIRYGYQILFVQRARKRLIELVFSFQSQAYQGQDLSKWAKHMPGKISGAKAQIIGIAYQPSRDLVWAWDSAGGLFACTRDRDQNVSAWHYHEFGGAFAGAAPQVVSAAVAPDSNGNDQLWLIVKRTVNGATVCTIEAMADDFELSGLDAAGATGTDAAIYLDCAKSLSGASSVTWPGFSHLIGQTLRVFGNGKRLSDVVVPGSGIITISTASTAVVAGLYYEGRLQPIMDREVGSQIGSGRGSKLRLDHVTVSMRRSAALKVGPDSTRLEDADFRPAGSDPALAIPLFTGDKVLEFRGDVDDDDPAILLINDQSLPLEITGVVVKGELSE